VLSLITQDPNDDESTPTIIKNSSSVLRPWPACGSSRETSVLFPFAGSTEQVSLSCSMCSFPNARGSTPVPLPLPAQEASTFGAGPLSTGESMCG